MEKKNSPQRRLAEIIKRLENDGRKTIDMSDKVKAIGFVGGIGWHQNESDAAPNCETLTPGQRNAARSGKED